MTLESRPPDAEPPAGQSKIPAAAAALGIAGLVPFVGLAGLAVIGHPQPLAEVWRALALYGAVILSFLGGVHWGRALAVPRASDFGASVVPSIVAWLAVTALPGRAAIPPLAAGFAALLIYDLARVRDGALPAWYAPLRLRLTAVVIGAFAVALLATWR